MYELRLHRYKNSKETSCNVSDQNGEAKLQTSTTTKTAGPVRRLYQATRQIQRKVATSTLSQGRFRALCQPFSTKQRQS